jgi:hypothetical protein
VPADHRKSPRQGSPCDAARFVRLCASPAPVRDAVRAEVSIAAALTRGNYAPAFFILSILSATLWRIWACSSRYRDLL